MSKLGQYRNNNEQIDNPTSVYLDNIKGNLWVWNKDKWENDFHTLDKFIILSVWFTIKGKVWDDNLKSYTNTYFSNEIRQFNETIYAIDMTFNPTTKTLVAKGNWKTDVKPHMPQAVGIKAMITVLDLNDGLIKAFPVAASQYFWDTWLQESITSFEPTDILSYSITKMYTNWTKNKDGSDIMITEEKLDAMKWSEAAKYKNRYISKLTKVSEGDKESIEAAEELVDSVDEYYKSKRKYYEDTYGKWEKKEQWTYAQPSWIQSDEEFSKEVKEEEPVKHFEAKGKTEDLNSTDSLSISSIPF